MNYSRRHLLAATGGVAAGLTGCLGSGGTDEETPEPDDNATEPDGNATGLDDDAPTELSIEDLGRTDETEGVSYAVYFVNPLVEAGGDHYLRDETEDSLVFLVEMETHSGDLTTVEWGELGTLTTSDGFETDSLEWVWESESDHHPEGYYRVSKTDDEGEPVVGEETETVELTVRETDDETVSFTWNLQSLADAESPAEQTLTSYISNSTSGTVSVIDHESRAVVDTVKVADRTSHGIAARPGGNFFYVGDSDSGNIYVISTERLEIVETVEVGSNAHGIDIDPSGQYLYVSGGSVGVRGDVAVVDVESYEVVEWIETEGAGHINFGPDGEYAYVSNVDMDQIAVIDTQARELLTTVPVGAGPNEAVASPDGEYVYTANVNGNTVSVVETGSWEEIERIPAGEGTHGIDISPDGRYVWTANRGSNDVTIIDTDDREVVETTASDENVNHLAVTPDGSAVYVTAVRSDEVLIIDTVSYDVVGRMDVGKEPHEIAFTVNL